MQAEHGKDVWLVGGSGLIKQALEERLLNELQLTTIPVLIGSGVPLFLPFEGDVQLQLTHDQAYDNGIVQRHYTLLYPKA